MQSKPNSTLEGSRWASNRTVQAMVLLMLASTVASFPPVPNGTHFEWVGSSDDGNWTIAFGSCLGDSCTSVASPNTTIELFVINSGSMWMKTGCRIVLEHLNPLNFLERPASLAHMAAFVSTNASQAQILLPYDRTSVVSIRLDRSPDGAIRCDRKYVTSRSKLLGVSNLLSGKSLVSEEDLYGVGLAVGTFTVGRLDLKFLNQTQGGTCEEGGAAKTLTYGRMPANAFTVIHTNGRTFVAAEDAGDDAQGINERSNRRMKIHEPLFDEKESSQCRIIKINGRRVIKDSGIGEIHSLLWVPPVADNPLSGTIVATQHKVCGKALVFRFTDPNWSSLPYSPTGVIEMTAETVELPCPDWCPDNGTAPYLNETGGVEVLPKGARHGCEITVSFSRKDANAASESDSNSAVLIAVPVGCAFILAVAAAVGFRVCCRKRHADQDGTEPSEEMQPEPGSEVPNVFVSPGREDGRTIVMWSTATGDGDLAADSEDHPSATPQDPYQVVPQRIEYRLGNLIGQGGFGRVYEALNVDTGELMAVKEMLIPQGDQQAKQRKALQREIENLRILQHPNVVRMYGTAVEGNSVFVIMEQLGGGSVDKLLRDFGVLDKATITKLVHQLLLGLECVHAHGFVHRDIKCGNLLLGRDGEAKVADFGASRHEGTVDNISGTPLWMAPEVCRGELATKASDVWSVGCTVIEMVTGQPPFLPLIGHSGGAVIFVASLQLDPPLPQEIIDVPELHQFVSRCMRRDPEARATVSELLEDPLFSGALDPLDAGLPTLGTAVTRAAA